MQELKIVELEQNKSLSLLVRIKPNFEVYDFMVAYDFNHETKDYNAPKFFRELVQAQIYFIEEGQPSD